MIRYAFEWFLKERCRYGWLSPLSTPESLKKDYFNDYLEYCKDHGLMADTIEEADKFLNKYR